MREKGGYAIMKEEKGESQPCGGKCMIIKNVKVFTEDQIFQEGEIHMVEDRFENTGGDKDGKVLDGKGCFAIPGLIDLIFMGAKAMISATGLWKRSRRSPDMRLP